jgi:hypothetical protein
MVVSAACGRHRVSTGSGSDRVNTIEIIEIAEVVTRSLPLPVLTSYSKIATDRLLMHARWRQFYLHSPQLHLHLLRLHPHLRWLQLH